MEAHELIRWAIKEIRELDELARSMVPGYESLESDDIIKLRELEALAQETEEIAEIVAEDLDDFDA